MKARGQHFLDVPDTYYDNLRERLAKAKIHVNEDIDTVNIYTSFSCGINGKPQENLLE